MLIRLANDELVEYPDELGALVLADPGCGDVPDFSLEELNCVISGALGMLFDESLSLEQNIAEARAEYTKWGKPDAENMKKALAFIALYNKNIASDDIGYSDSALVNSFYGIVSPEKASRQIFNNRPSNSEGESMKLTDTRPPSQEG